MHSPTTTTRATISVHVRDEYHQLKQSTNFVGWVGIIISSLLVLASLIALYGRNTVADIIFGEYFEAEDSVDINKIVRVVAIISSTLYALSLINVVVCTMLLIGVARRCCCLIFPWLLFNGLLFCAGLHFSIYLIISGFCIQFEHLVILVLASMCTVFLFFKMYGDVLNVYRKLHDDAKEEKRIAAQLELTGEREAVMRLEDSKNSSVPYQSFI